MLFEHRLRLAEQLLREAATEGQVLILFGSGVWFASLERALVRRLKSYAGRVSVQQTRPLLRVAFRSGGSLQCVDLENGHNLHLIKQGTTRVPNKAYLVEDALGVNARVWVDSIKPFLQDGECQVRYLGNNQNAKPTGD